ncbi:hypothetical protein FRC0432_02190 [Corynebacterium diphtheriae]|nr:hypothetical protein FRC0432_02190 [Corynebacterium diphtheriae]
MSTLIDTLVGMKDTGIAEIAQLGRTMNKRRKDILAYIRYTINALYNRKSPFYAPSCLNPRIKPPADEKVIAVSEMFAPRGARGEHCVIFRHFPF